MGTSIAIDSGGKVHISYFDYTNFALKYATHTTGAWTKATLDNLLGNFGGYTSIAIGGSGKVHISYYYNAIGALKYVTGP